MDIGMGAVGSVLCGCLIAIAAVGTSILVSWMILEGARVGHAIRGKEKD